MDISELMFQICVAFIFAPKVDGQIFPNNSKGLTSVPTGIPLDTVELLLANNQLTDITPGFFEGLYKLTILHLFGNKLSVVPDLSTVGNTLQVLLLQGNQITSIPAHVLDSMSALQELNLASNQLTIINDEDFTGLVSLKNLSLSKNKLTIVPNLNGVGKTLQKLLLSGNNITSFLGNSLRNMSALTDLDLANNHLTILPDLSNLGRLLTYLHLWDNQISIIPDFHPANPATLTINAGGNPLDLGACENAWLKQAVLDGATVLGVNTSNECWADAGYQMLQQQCAANSHITGKLNMTKLDV